MTLNPTAEEEGLTRWRLHLCMHVCHCVLVCACPHSGWSRTTTYLVSSEWYPGNNNKELLWVVAVPSCLAFFFFHLRAVKPAVGLQIFFKAPFCIIYWPLLHLPCRLVPLSEKAPLQSVRKTLLSLFTSTNRQAEGHSQVCVCECLTTSQLPQCPFGKRNYLLLFFHFCAWPTCLPLCSGDCKAAAGHQRRHIMSIINDDTFYYPQHKLKAICWGFVIMDTTCSLYFAEISHMW